MFKKVGVENMFFLVKFNWTPNSYKLDDYLPYFAKYLCYYFCVLENFLVIRIHQSTAEYIWHSFLVLMLQ